MTQETNTQQKAKTTAEAQVDTGMKAKTTLSPKANYDCCQCFETLMVAGPNDSVSEDAAEVQVDTGMKAKATAEAQVGTGMKAKTTAEAQVDTGMKAKTTTDDQVGTGMKEQARSGCAGRKWLMVVFLVFVVILVSATVALLWTGGSGHEKRVRPVSLSANTMSGPGIQDVQTVIDHLRKTALQGNSSELTLPRYGTKLVLPFRDEDTGKNSQVLDISVEVRTAPLADLPEGVRPVHPSDNKSAHTASTYLLERYGEDGEVFSSGVLECTDMGGGFLGGPACEVKEESGSGRKLGHRGSWKRVVEVVCLVEFYICGDQLDPSCRKHPIDYDRGERVCCPYTNQVWCQWAVIKVWKWVSCFPPSGLVESPTGQKPISELRVGDRVLTPSGFEQVYFNTHAEEAMPLPYLRFALNTGEVSEASPGHYVMADGQYRLARNVAPGMQLQRKGGGWGSVTQIDRVVRPGAFNPLTLSGKIIVDGIVWSVWSDWIAEGLLPEAWIPDLYQLIFLPIRALYHVTPKLVGDFVEDYRSTGSLGNLAPSTILAKVTELLRRPSGTSTLDFEDPAQEQNETSAKNAICGLQAMRHGKVNPNIMVHDVGLSL